MFNTMQQIFDEAEAIEREHRDRARLYAQDFAFSLSDRDFNERPSYQAPAPVIFEYVPTWRHNDIPQNKDTTHFFQVLGLEDARHRLPGNLNGSFRLSRKTKRAEVQPEKNDVRYDIVFTFEYIDIWNTGVAVAPIVLPDAFLPGHEGVIERQTPPDQYGRSAGIHMKLVTLKAV